MPLHKIFNRLTIFIWIAFFIILIVFFNASPLLTETIKQLTEPFNQLIQALN